MEKQIKPSKRNKPAFFRRGWTKKIRLGSTVKKNRKWRGAKGRDNKTRLKEKAYPKKPGVGWQSDKKIRGNVMGVEAVRVENLEQLKAVGKSNGVIIGRVGKKKKEEIMKVCKEKGLKVLNRYTHVKSGGKEDATG